MSNTDDKKTAIPGINTPTEEDKGRVASAQDKDVQDTGANTSTSRIQSAADKAAGAEKKPEEKTKYVEPE